MLPVSDVRRLPRGIWYWQAYEPEVRCDLTSTALETGDGVIFIDPIRLADDALARVLDGRVPSAIVLTNGNHQRDSLALRDRLAVPIFGPEVNEIIRDHAISALGTCHPGLRAIPLPGAGPGEHAIFRPGERAVLVFGDAVIHLPPDGLRPLPEKYCEDPMLARRSLAILRGLNPEVLTFAHGEPICENAPARLLPLI